MDSANHDRWDLIIDSKRYPLNFNIREIFKYKDLIFLLVRRDFVSVYKQTILGPLWFFIQPVLTTLTFVVIFGNIAKIPTNGGIPHILFYMSGITLWNYFSDCLIKTSNTFSSNQDLFGKIYFPRLIIPLSIVFTNCIKLLIQFFLFLIIWFYYFLFKNGTGTINPSIYILFLPILIIIMAILGLGLGMIISSLTTKYKDLSFLVSFGIQLSMYATTIIIPISKMQDKFKFFILLNPMTSIIEIFRYGFFGTGDFNFFWLIYSAFFALFVLLVGILVFNRVERSFIDTV